MHLYVFARGQVDRLNRWENDLTSKYIPYAVGKVHPEINKGKQDIVKGYQLNVRPIRMYEIAFPEPELQPVLGMIAPGKAWNSSYDKYVKIIQKTLGLEPLPEFKAQEHENLNNPLFLNRNWVDCTAIGLKKDRYQNGIELI